MYFNDHGPPHVHVVKTSGQAKIAIGSPGIAPTLLRVQGMNEKEARDAIAIVQAHQIELLGKWEEIYG